MRSFLKSVLLILTGILSYSPLYSQNKDLIYIQHISSDAPIDSIYNTVGTPLFVIGNSVYAVDSDCITGSFGGFARGSGEGSKTLSKGRESADGSKALSKPRQSGEGSKTLVRARESADGNKALSKPRESADGSKTLSRPRESADGSKGLSTPRKSGEGSSSFYCEINSSGKLIVYLPAFRKNENIRIYYENAFINKKYYKIKPL